MTTYDWRTLRDHAIEQFNGDTPGAELEHAIVNHFTEHPARVATAIDNIGRKVAAGNIRSGWAILLRELDSKPTNAQATDNAERAKAISRTETWLRNSGGYIETESELEDELFGDLGKLRTWPELKPRITQLWLEQRPRFTQAEADHETRCRTQTALRAATRPRTTCRYCPRTTRSPTGVCTEHRNLLEEDFRYAHLDELAATVDLDQTAGTLENGP